MNGFFSVLSSALLVLGLVTIGLQTPWLVVLMLVGLAWLFARS